MDWLSLYHAILDFYAKTMTLDMPNILRIEWIGLKDSYPSKVVSYIWAQNLIDRRCLAYLAFIFDIVSVPPFIDSIPVVYEFPDVFSTDLPRVPPDRDIDFPINLKPDTKPISIAPYRMTLAKLKELKES